VESVALFKASVEKFITQSKRGASHKALKGDDLFRAGITLMAEVVEELRVSNDMKRSEVCSLSVSLRLSCGTNEFVKMGLAPTRVVGGQFAVGRPAGSSCYDEVEAAYAGLDYEDLGNIFSQVAQMEDSDEEMED
jgi:hypothetical protein